MATIEHITTAEQLLHVAGVGRCELLRGELIMMSPSGAEHGYVVMNISVSLGAFIKQKELGKAYGAETGFCIARKPDTVRAPDVSFVGAQRAAGDPGKGFFEGAPDLAVEVVSPSDRASEVVTKVKEWLDAGCRLAWVVDPQTRTVSVYRRNRITTVLGVNDYIDGEDVVPGFTMPVAAVFA